MAALSMKLMPASVRYTYRNHCLNSMYGRSDVHVGELVECASADQSDICISSVCYICSIVYCIVCVHSVLLCAWLYFGLSRSLCAICIIANRWSM